MTKEDIFDHLQFLHPDTANKFIDFITRLLLYDEDTKKVLDELGLAYITLNTKTINNIKKHQKEQDLKFSIDLKVRNTAIVLKKLLK